MVHTSVPPSYYGLVLRFVVSAYLYIECRLRLREVRLLLLHPLDRACPELEGWISVVVLNMILLNLDARSCSRLCPGISFWHNWYVGIVPNIVWYRKPHLIERRYFFLTRSIPQFHNYLQFGTCVPLKI